MGGSVAAAGDVNNDGHADVVVTSGATSVVFLGSPTGLEGTHTAEAHAVITLDAATSMTSVAGAGDINGDGFGDIIMGARFYPIQNSTTQEGAAFVFLGSSLGIATTGTSQAHAAFFGNLLAEWLGSDVAGVGDVNGDGFGDIAITARLFPGSLDSEGVAHIFFGSVDGITAGGLADANVRLSSGQSRASIFLNTFSASVAGAGDVNGDGFADVIFGTPFYDAGEEDEGAAFVYLGGPAPPIPNLPPVPNAGADQVVYDLDSSGSATITVDGSASVDPDGIIESYAWREGETLLGTSPVLTTSLSATGDHTLVLTVTDNNGSSRGDPVTVRVERAQTTQLFNDSFPTDLGAWVSGGDVVLFPPQARLGASGAFLSRSIALPVGATGVSLSFWGTASQFSAADELLVKVSVDGGPFTTIHTITSADSNDTPVFYGGSAIPIYAGADGHR